MQHLGNLGLQNKAFFELDYSRNSEARVLPLRLSYVPETTEIVRSGEAEVKLYGSIRYARFKISDKKGYNLVHSLKRMHMVH